MLFLGDFLTLFGLWHSLLRSTSSNELWLETDGDPVLRNKRTTIGRFPVCPYGCTSCSEVNGCLKCDTQFSLLLYRQGIRQTGQCVHSCPDGYYQQNQPFRLCRAECLISNCSKCQSVDTCAKCVSPLKVYQGRCIDDCSEGLSYNFEAKDCLSSVECVVSTWSPWGQCKSKGQFCGGRKGIRVRTRDIVQSLDSDSSNCPITVDIRKCKLKRRTCEDILNNTSDPSDNKLGQKHRLRYGKGTEKETEGDGRDENEIEKTYRNGNATRKKLINAT